MDADEFCTLNHIHLDNKEPHIPRKIRI